MTEEEKNDFLERLIEAERKDRKERFDYAEKKLIRRMIALMLIVIAFALLYDQFPKKDKHTELVDRFTDRLVDRLKKQTIERLFSELEITGEGRYVSVAQGQDAPYYVIDVTIDDGYFILDIISNDHYLMGEYKIPIKKEI